MPDHRADPGQYALGQKIAHQPRWQHVRHHARDRTDRAFQRVGKGSRPGEHRLEDHEKKAEQDHRAEPGVQQYPVRAVFDRMARAFRKDRAARDVLGGKAPFGQRQVPAAMRVFIGMAFGLRNGRGQFGEALAADGDGRDHRHAQRIGQGLGIEGQPVALGKVDHVERDHGRPAQFEHFLREDEVLFEIGGVEDDDEHIRRALALEFAGHDIAGHRFVGAGGIEAVRTGQIEQFDAVAAPVLGRKRQPPRLALHGYAGIIRNFLARAGQRVE